MCVLSAEELRASREVIVDTFVLLDAALCDLSHLIRRKYYDRGSTAQLCSLRASFQTLCESAKSVKKHREKLKNESSKS